VELKLSSQGLSIVVSNHSRFEPRESDVSNAVTYELDPASGPRATSRHSVEVGDPSGKSRWCMLTASGGATGVHEHSALVHAGSVIIAVGAHLCALRLPTLDLEWSIVVDTATCFGVYYSAKYDCYVSHGEIAVARVALDGRVVWSASGKDIFSEGFALHDDHAEVIDFNHETYRINLATGRSFIVE
jgi:hypothetical protein